jgi:hypothetical protein
VAIALRPRLQKKEAQKALENAARSRGPRSQNMVAHLFKPQREVQQALKAKSAWLDVRDISQLEEVLQSRRGARYEVIYGYWQPKPKGKAQE